MAHLVRSYADISYADLLSELRDAHRFLVERASDTLQHSLEEPARWGSAMKRLEVRLSPRPPGAIGKSSERLVEVVNITATLERMLDALEWFSATPDFASLRILECHPSTSSAIGANDIALGLRPGDLTVRCEVTDVVGNKAGQNGKERGDLASLGCADFVPNDRLRRFVCTSAEFASALTAGSRKWSAMHYQYATHAIGAGGTALLEILPPVGKLKTTLQTRSL